MYGTAYSLSSQVSSSSSPDSININISYESNVFGFQFWYLKLRFKYIQEKGKLKSVINENGERCSDCGRWNWWSSYFFRT